MIHPLASAMETVQLALEMRDLGVVGIDLAGNPVVGQWQTFVPPLEYAKEQGLRVTLHCGEVPDSSEESLAAVAGMFSSKAKGIEWSLDNDASNAAVVVASEAHAITLAVEGLLGVVFTVATLTDEAVDVGEIESPRCVTDPPGKCMGETAALCISMVDSMWLTILDALSLILTRSQGEAIILEILKGYQAFTQACGVLRAVEPLNSFLASLCKFTISFPSEAEKRRDSYSAYGFESANEVERSRRLQIFRPAYELLVSLVSFRVQYPQDYQDLFKEDLKDFKQTRYGFTGIDDPYEPPSYTTLSIHNDQVEGRVIGDRSKSKYKCLLPRHRKKRDNKA